MPLARAIADLAGSDPELEIRVLTGVPVTESDAQILILDVDGSVAGGPQFVATIHRQHPKVKILALSSHIDKQFVAQTLSAGASAYVVRDCIFEDLLRAVHALRVRRSFTSPCLDGPGKT